MTLAIGRLFVLALLGLAMAACGQDMSPRPRFVSIDGDRGPLTASPSPKSAGVIVAAAEGGSNEDKGDAYFIEFRSRYALSYGHSYVVFGRANKAGEMIDPEVAGLHPTSYNASVYMLGHVVPVPAETGASDGDLEEPYRSASWRIMVSEPRYQTVVAYTPAAGQLTRLGRFVPQLQRLRRRRRAVHGLQDPSNLASAAAIHDQASRDEHKSRIEPRPLFAPTLLPQSGELGP